MTTEIVPIHALEVESVRNAALTCDVIFGMDVQTAQKFLVYGRKILERIATTKVAEEVSVTTIGLDAETDELEFLIAAVRHYKGSDDYVHG